MKKNAEIGIQWRTVCYSIKLVIKNYTRTGWMWCVTSSSHFSPHWISKIFSYSQIFVSSNIGTCSLNYRHRNNILSLHNNSSGFLDIFISGFKKSSWIIQRRIMVSPSHIVVCNSIYILAQFEHSRKMTKRNIECQDECCVNTHSEWKWLRQCTNRAWNHRPI